MAAYWLPFDPCFIEAVRFACGERLLIEREGQTANAFALTLVKQVRSPAFTWMELPDFLQWKKVEKHKIHYASTKGKREAAASGKLKPQRMIEGKKKSLHSLVWTYVVVFFRKADLFDTAFSPDTMPLTQAKRSKPASPDSWTGQQNSLALLLIHRFWSCLFLRGM